MPGSQLRQLAQRIAAATPPDRDRAVDALRALAIAGVVFGHWIVTAMVVDGDTIHGASPLRYHPQLAVTSWVFQALAIFFLVGGRVATHGWESARRRGIGYRHWLWGRMARLARPVTIVVALWIVIAAVMLAAGTDFDTVRNFVKLVISPLWFLGVYAGLAALTPLVAKLHPVWPLAVVLAVDFSRFGVGGPDWLGPVNIAAGWLVPYCLGALWAREGLRSRRAGWGLLIGGAATTAALIWGLGYPASMVGVPGEGISNLNPPTLAAVTFGLAQCGAALLLTGPLRRLLRRPLPWAAVAIANRYAMTVFGWHQTAMIAVTACGLLIGPNLPGLHAVPDSGGWILARLAWLPVFALALAICVAAFRTYEQAKPPPPIHRTPPTGRPSVATTKGA